MAKTRRNDTPVPMWAKRLAAARMMVADDQTEFANSIGMSQQRYNNYELGKREPNLAMWAILAKALHVSIDFLMLGNGDAAAITDRGGKSKPANEGRRTTN